MYHKIIDPEVEEYLKFFKYQHLPPHLQSVSKQCSDLAHSMTKDLSGPQLLIGLQKLLEAKDCFVRAKLP